jgi:hypothetical protein
MLQKKHYCNLHPAANIPFFPIARSGTAGIAPPKRRAASLPAIRAHLPTSWWCHHWRAWRIPRHPRTENPNCHLCVTITPTSSYGEELATAVLKTKLVHSIRVWAWTWDFSAASWESRRVQPYFGSRVRWPWRWEMGDRVTISR